MEESGQTAVESLSKAFSSMSSSLTSSSKYGGLIQIPFHKQIRNTMVVINAHFDQAVPYWFTLHFIISMLRLAQFFGPIFLAGDEMLYTKGSASYTTVQYLSILYRYIPVGMNLELLTIGLFVYSGLSFFFYTSFVLSALYYRKAAKLPDVVSYALSVYMSTFGYLLQPFCGSLIGEIVVGLAIQRPNDSIISVISIFIAIIFIAIICCIIYLLLKVLVFAHNVNFKPDSLMFVHGKNLIIMETLSILINFILTAAARLSFLPKIGLIVIGIILYILSSYFVSLGPAFVKPRQHAHFIGFSIACIISLILAILFIVFGMKGDMIFLVSCLIIACLSNFLGAWITNKERNQNLIFLDEIEENDPVELNVSVNKFLSAAVSGYQASHPVCVSFKIFEIGLGTWPDNVLIMCIFAKFIAIYPECTKRLEAIQKKLSSIGVHSKYAKQLTHQIISIISQRENVVSPSLKKKLNSVQKKINTAKRKIQNIWDFIIQSNLPELGPAINAAYKATNIAETEIIKLKRTYPNNTFVSRAYSRFLIELKRDFMKANMEQDTIKILRKGILAVPDKTNELGIYAFPNLPHNVEVAQLESFLNIEFGGESEININIIEEDKSFEIEACHLIMDKIQSIRLPAIKKTVISSIVICSVVCIVPVVTLLCLNLFYVSSIYEAVLHMRSISALRSLNFQMSSDILRIALEELTHKMDPVYPPNYVPINLNRSTKTRDHLAVFIASAGRVVSESNDMRDFKKSNENMNKIRSYLFSNTVKFKYYQNSSNYKDVMMSGINIVLDTALQGSRILSTNTLNESVLEKTEFLNPRLNVEELGNGLSKALVIFVTFVKNQCVYVQTTLLYAQILYSALVALVYISLVGYSIFNAQKETNEIYTALTLLPKNDVSRAADYVRILKKESMSTTESTSNQEINKQEETIIKVFMSANESSNGNSVMNAIQIAAALISAGCTIIAINLILILYSDQYQTLLINAPHLDYILGTSAYIYGSFISINTIVVSQSYKQIDSNYSVHIDRFNYRIGKFVEFYNAMRYGGSLMTESPFIGFKHAIDIANEMLMCDDVMLPPKDLFNAFPCYDVETQFILFAILSRRIVKPFIAKNIDKTFTKELDPGDDLKVENTYINYLWSLGPISIYDTFVKPLDLILEGTILDEMNSNVKNTMTISAVMILIVIAMTVIIIITIKELERRVKYFLSLLLHIVSKTILSTNKIMSILNGNIMGRSFDSSTRDNEFYDEVVEKLINGVIVIDELNKIVSMNTFVVKTFSLSDENYVGKDISLLFDERFGGDISKVIDKSSLEEALITFKNEYFQITKIVSKQNIILNIKDETARINHLKLISEERTKSDRMLSSILPASMVPRVQAGEKNISFAVQSASVLFLDIVSFTPWCGSHDAWYIMKTLNMLFKELDKAIQEFPVMTKIKCIGDCYMAAGGIFEEINQPAVHAKQCVEFGLRAIEAVRKLNTELKENLEIRVGVNTGGPLVAGVIGTGKPTFEILGPAINMAQQMEHHGVPMKVHISRSTYELIYGGTFNIKERGQVEVKNGTVNTYVVSL